MESPFSFICKFQSFCPNLCLFGVQWVFAISFLTSSICFSIPSFILFSFLVCVALFASDTSNLPGGRDLSTTFLQIGENNFSFFSCHARKPYGHKGFRRLQAGKLSGKIFPLGHQFRRSAAGKQREGLPAGKYQEINPRDKPKRKGPGKGRKEGMEWK